MIVNFGKFWFLSIFKLLNRFMDFLKWLLDKVVMKVGKYVLFFGFWWDSFEILFLFSCKCFIKLLDSLKVYLLIICLFFFNECLNIFLEFL